MKDYTCDSPVFSESIKTLTPTDPGHADNVNVTTEQLLQNTLVNKQRIDALADLSKIAYSEDSETIEVADAVANYEGPCYLRFSRAATNIIYDEDKTFEIGKAIQHGDGTKATVFATGVVVAEALKAQEILKEEGIDIRVVDIHTIKPIDRETIIKCAYETDKLISIEDHSIIGGLGSAISEVLTDEYPKKLIRMGMKDCFGKSGKAIELLEYFGLVSQNIVEEVKK